MESKLRDCTKPTVPTLWTGSKLMRSDGFEIANTFGLQQMPTQSHVRRSRLELCLDVLDVIASEGQAHTTRLMFKANLSWRNLRETIGYLEDRALVKVEKVEARQIIELTPIGQRLLILAKELRSLLTTEVDTGASWY